LQCCALQDDLDGLDEILNDPSIMAELSEGGTAQRREGEGEEAFVAKTGAENARIGMAGFSQATKNPAMFQEAMGMLNDPNAVKEVRGVEVLSLRNRVCADLAPP
jgi:hypothetical protein